MCDFPCVLPITDAFGFILISPILTDFKYLSIVVKCSISKSLSSLFPSARNTSLNPFGRFAISSSGLANISAFIFPNILSLLLSSILLITVPSPYLSKLRFSNLAPKLPVSAISASNSAILSAFNTSIALYISGLPDFNFLSAATLLSPISTIGPYTLSSYLVTLPIAVLTSIGVTLLVSK